MRFAEQNKKKFDPRYFLTEMNVYEAEQHILNYMASQNIMPSDDSAENILIKQAANSVRDGENPDDAAQRVTEKISQIRDKKFKKLSGTAEQAPEFRAGFEKIETASREGMRCKKTALPIQQAIFAAISKLNPQLKNSQILSKRLSDGIVGHTTVQAINIISKATSGMGLPQYSDDAKGFAEVCGLDQNTVARIVATIKTLDTEIINALSNLILKEPKKQDVVQVKGGVSGTANQPPTEKVGSWQLPPGGFYQRRPEEVAREVGLEEAKRRDTSYNKLNEQKQKKLFKALVKG